MDMNAPWRALEASQAAEGESGAASSDAAGSGRSMPAGRRLALAAAALLVVGSLAVAGIVAMRPTGQVEVVGPPGGGAAGASQWPGASAGTSASQAIVVVQVAGAVARPGVYSLPVGSRVADAIQAAGGYSTEVDPRAAETKLNLAAKLQDAQLIAVPRRGETSSGAAGAGGASVAGASTTPGLINLNTATAEQLDTLPGVGPATAQKIIASRVEKPFAKVDDLVTRKVMTASTLSKLRSLVTVD